MVAIVLTMVRPTPSTIMHTLPQNLGDPALNTWILSWQSHALTRNPSQWFNGNVFGTHGSALGYSELMLPLVPVFGVALWLSGSAIVAMNVAHLAALCFAMFATFALGRYMQLSRSGSVFAATAFTFTSFTFAHVGHLQLLTFGFFPLGLLLLLKVLDRQRVRDGVAFGFVTFGLVTGCLYYATIWIPIVAAVVLVDLWRLRGKPGKQWWASVTAAAATSIVLLAPIAILYLHFQQSAHFTRTVDSTAGADASDLLAPAPGSYLYRSLSGAAWQRPASVEHSSFPGVIVLGFAGLAVLIAVSKAASRARVETISSNGTKWKLLGVAGLVSALLAVGTHFAGLPMPFKFAFEYFPGFDSIRVPARLIVPLLLVLGVAAAAALAWATRALHLPLTATTLAVLGLLLVELMAPTPRVDARPSRQQAQLYSLMRDLPDGDLVEIPAASQVDGAAGVYLEAPRMLFSIGDWRVRFNGTSGGDPPGFGDEVKLVNSFPSAESLTFLRLHNIRFVILHTSADSAPFTVSPEVAAQAEQQLKSALVVALDDAVIFDLGQLDD